MAVMTPKEIYDILYDEDFRTSMVIKETASETYNPDTGDVTEGTETEHTVYISPPMVKERFENGELVKASDLIVYFSSYDLSFTPGTGLECELDGETYFIVELNSYEAGGGDIALYEAGLRK